jgi:uncharacterized damage-inducible protein DinB
VQRRSYSPAMEAALVVARLARLPAALTALVDGLPDADWRWRPKEGGWSILEIVNHLADEEVFDFRARVQSTLEDSTRSWPAMDPEGWVTQRRYQEQDPADSLRRVLDERAKSLAWLRGLVAPDWEATYKHARGDLRAGDLLASWAAHDARHLTQIGKRLHGLAARDGEPYDVGYAG